MSQSTEPTLTGFSTFIYNVMGISPLLLPTDSPIIAYAFGVSQEIVNPHLPRRSYSGAWSVYALAVFNLGGSNIINFAPDQQGRTWFAEQRKAYGVSGFVPGILTGESDAGTASSYMTPDFMKGLTLANLQALKDPWGRAYLSLAQDYGPTAWGIS